MINLKLCTSELFNLKVTIEESINKREIELIRSRNENETIKNEIIELKKLKYILENAKEE